MRGSRRSPCGPRVRHCLHGWPLLASQPNGIGWASWRHPCIGSSQTRGARSARIRAAWAITGPSLFAGDAEPASFSNDLWFAHGDKRGSDTDTTGGMHGLRDGVNPSRATIWIARVVATLRADPYLRRSDDGGAVRRSCDQQGIAGGHDARRVGSSLCRCVHICETKPKGMDDPKRDARPTVIGKSLPCFSRLSGMPIVHENQTGEDASLACQLSAHQGVHASRH